MYGCHQTPLGDFGEPVPLLSLQLAFVRVCVTSKHRNYWGPPPSCELWIRLQLIGKLSLKLNLWFGSRNKQRARCENMTSYIKSPKKTAS